MAERMARLEERVDNFIEAWKLDRDIALRARAEAENAHRKIAEGLQILNESVKAAMNEVQIVKAKVVNEIEPTLDGYRIQQAESRGQWRLASAMRLALVTLLSVAMSVAATWVQINRTQPNYVTPRSTGD